MVANTLVVAVIILLVALIFGCVFYAFLYSHYDRVSG